MSDKDLETLRDEALSATAGDSIADRCEHAAIVDSWAEFAARGVAAQATMDRVVGDASTDDEVDQLGAFRETVAFAEERGMPDDPDSDLGLDHLRRMLAKVEDGVATLSPGKLGRWLGWAQAAVVAARIGTLDDMKAINNRHKIVR